MSDPSDPTGGEPKPFAGVRPLVTFHNQTTGEVIRVRTSPTNDAGSGLGTVTFPDRGPWTATLTVGGKPFEAHGEAFPVGPPASAAATPPATSQPAAHDDGGFPLWLLSFPAAGLAALGLRRLRRRPRELGA